MPIYEYKCKKCNSTAQRLVKIDERDNQICKCGNKADRVISQGYVKFKGEGWTTRTTDYLDYLKERQAKKNGQL